MQDSDLERVTRNAERIRAIVMENGGDNIRPGLDALLDRLRAGDVAGARSIFETLLQKKGLLGDFYVADDDRDARLLNEELSALLDENWTLLEAT